jgi:hypothetical protein
VLSLFSKRLNGFAIVFVASLAAAGIVSAQGAAGAGTNQGLSASALPAQPVATGSADATAGNAADASASSLPTAANASRPAPASSTWADNDAEITGEQRVAWAAIGSIGPLSLMYGVLPAGVGTALNHPREYGTHWEGFGDRYGMRLAGLATSNTMEASLGAIWHENPRYKREPEKSFGGRVESVIYQTFFTRRPDGNFEPAYARFLAIPGSNFLSNTWRANSEADTSHAFERTGYGFAGAMGGNAFKEFWPDIKSHLHM